MSKLEVDAIEPQSGTTLTLGASGDAVALGSGASVSGLTLSDNILFNAASKGIYLGVTTATASNLLDDYEEGTWTPVISNFTQGNGNFVRATYRKIGKLVTISFDLTWGSTTSASGTMRISGLPFTVQSSGHGCAWLFDSGTGDYGFTATLPNSTGTSWRIMNNTTELSSSSPFTWGNDDRINFSGSYQTN
jgi:hypothetical protein